MRIDINRQLNTIYVVCSTLVHHIEQLRSDLSMFFTATTSRCPKFSCSYTHFILINWVSIEIEISLAEERPELLLTDIYQYIWKYQSTEGYPSIVR